MLLDRNQATTIVDVIRELVAEMLDETFHGQRRRVSFAAMVARRPELWLLDEPHAGLDAGGRDVIDGLIREAASVGATVLFASHELDRAGDVADRTVEVVGGTAVPLGQTAHEVPADA